MESVLHHFAPKVIVPIEVGRYDLSITDYTLWMWGAMLVTFMLLTVVARRAKLVPRGMQTPIESVVEFVRNEIALGVIGKEGEAYFSYLATMFFFILACNLTEIIPGAKTPTAVTGTTVAWAVMVFFTYHLVGMKKNGLWGYAKSFVPTGTPVWLIPFIVPIEVISHVFRPVSLALRLFANMFAGHAVLGIFAFMAVTSSIWMKAIPISAEVIMFAFEIFVGFIQAYIFTMLTAIYIQGALHAH